MCAYHMLSNFAFQKTDEVPSQTQMSKLLNTKKLLIPIPREDYDPDRTLTGNDQSTPNMKAKKSKKIVSSIQKILNRFRSRDKKDASSVVSDKTNYFEDAIMNLSTCLCFECPKCMNAMSAIRVDATKDSTLEDEELCFITQYRDGKTLT